MSRPTSHCRKNRKTQSQCPTHPHNSHGVTQEPCRRLASVLRASPLAIVTLDLQGTVQSWNPAAEQMFGWSQEEVLRHPLPVVPQGEEVRYRNDWDALLRGVASTGKRGMSRKKDGSRFLSTVSSAPLFDENGNVEGSLYIFEASKDSPGGHALESPKSETVHPLARGLAHKLNNSVGSILGWAEMALDGLDHQSPLQKPLSHIFEQARQINEVTQDLAAFAECQAVEMYNVEPNQIVEQAIDRLADWLPRNTTLEKILAPALPRILADPEQIERVLMHICRYAQEAAPEGGALQIGSRQILIGRDKNPELAGAVPGNYVALCVSHGSLKSNSETLKHIFDPFFALSSDGNGSGLGLAAANGIVRQHGGCIRASCGPDYGTRFEVLLPLPASPFSLLRRRPCDDE